MGSLVGRGDLARGLATNGFTPILHRALGMPANPSLSGAACLCQACGEVLTTNIRARLLQDKTNDGKYTYRTRRVL